MAQGENAERWGHPGKELCSPNGGAWLPPGRYTKMRTARFLRRQAQARIRAMVDSGEALPLTEDELDEFGDSDESDFE